MAVKIRLARLGKKNAPVYRIVAIDSLKKRDGKFLENLGTYDPIKGKLVQYNEEAVASWISKGAQPSDAVKKIQRLHKAA